MDPLAPLIAALHSEGRLRVWSLVITIFGDLVQHRGGKISTARLGELMSRVGIEQGTLRTALSRLGRDGWVTSEREGRSSIYRLSEQGVKRFGPATARIYAPARPDPVELWAAVVTLGPNGGSGVQIVPADEAPSDADCKIVGSLAQISDAYQSAALGDAHRAALGALASDLSSVNFDIADPLDAAAARMLLIHRWRRIVLRHADVPAELMPEDTPLRDPRGAVAQVYAALTPVAETWLANPEEPAGLLPDTQPEGVTRFGIGLQA